METGQFRSLLLLLLCRREMWALFFSCVFENEEQ